MNVVSVSIGTARPLKLGGSSRLTGIFKNPADGPVAILREGVAGDTVCGARYHGGPDQAVYVYGQPDYDWWAGELGRAPSPGTFGENLTLTGFESATSRVGDRFHIGDLVLEITAPRIPCGTFAARMEDPQFVKRFRAAERPGVYCRVIREGIVRAGDDVRFEPCRTDTVSIIEMWRDHYKPELTESALRRFLSAPIAIRNRVEKEKQLRDLESRAAEAAPKPEGEAPPEPHRAHLESREAKRSRKT